MDWRIEHFKWPLEKNWEEKEIAWHVNKTEAEINNIEIKLKKKKHQEDSEVPWEKTLISLAITLCKFTEFELKRSGKKKRKRNISKNIEIC